MTSYPIPVCDLQWKEGAPDNKMFERLSCIQHCETPQYFIGILQEAIVSLNISCRWFIVDREGQVIKHNSCSLSAVGQITSGNINLMADLVAKCRADAEDAYEQIIATHLIESEILSDEEDSDNRV